MAEQWSTDTRDLVAATTANDTGTQYAGLTETEKVLARADDHMSTCDEPQMSDCETCTRRIGKYRKYLNVLAGAGLLVQPHTGPRVWAMPPPIPDHVDRVRDCKDHIWTRSRADSGNSWWVRHPDKRLRREAGLLAEYGPLTDATAEVLPNGD